MKVKFRNLESLKKAVRALGWEWREGQKTFKWYGRFLGDSPVPEGMTPEEYGKCEHAISVPNCSYEIGIRKVGDEWIGVYDSWCEGGLDRILGGEGCEEVVSPIPAAYAREEVLERLKELDVWDIKESVGEDGVRTIQVELGGGP